MTNAHSPAPSDTTTRAAPASPPHGATDRLAALEERLAFLERHVELLDQRLAEQTRDVLALREREAVLIERLRALHSRIDDGTAPSLNTLERPPHY